MADSGLAVADLERGVALALVERSGLRFCVFAVGQRDSWTPVEMRVLQAPSGRRSATAVSGLLADWTPPRHITAITAVALRQFRLGEAISLMPSVSDFARHPGAGLRISTPEEEFGFRRARDLLAALEQIRVAATYEPLAATGPRPVQRAADVLGMTPGQVRGLLAKARRNGYLTSPGGGSSGGRVTDRARRLVEVSKDLATWAKDGGIGT